MVLGEEVIVAASVFLVFLGGLVLLVRPGGSLNRLLALMLVLRGASDLMFQLMRQASNLHDALLYHAVAHWYDAPYPFLTALLLHRLFPPRAPAPWRRWALAAVALLNVALLPAILEEPEFQVVEGEDFRGLHPHAGPWGSAWTAFSYALRALPLVAAAHAVASPTRTALQRRQAALVGLAFLFLMGHAAVPRVARLALGIDGSWLSPVTPVSILWIAAALFALPRLVQPFDGPSRRVVALLALVPFLVGLADLYLARFPWYYNSRFLMHAAHAVCLALAIVRYDLLGMGARMRRRVETFSRAMLAAAALLLPAGAALLLLGATSAGVVVALTLGTGALAISPTPARALARRLALALTHDPLDPNVLAERSRIYAAALDRRADASELARLREGLDLRESDHEALERALALPGAHDPGRGPPLLGRYVVGREVGRGAFGTVLLARDLATRRDVVLKRYHAGWTERRVQAEAEALARVRHPRVVPLLAVERAGSSVFLVMEYVEGGTAQEMLDRSGPPPAARALDLALDVLEGLEAVHAAGLAHGDVKPANVLLDAGGRAMLADLGAAQALGRPEGDATLTSSPILGSYGTLAPEILRGARRSAAADVYSAGATLYRLLTGEDYVTLPRDDVVRATDAILHEPPRLPHPAVPAEVEPVLRRALAKRPEERYADAARMRKALAEAAGLAA